MKVKHIFAFLLITLILSSCAPAHPEVPPTETAVQTATSTLFPLPVTATQTPPDIPKRLATFTPTITRTVRPTSTPTITPNAPLSADGPWLLYLHKFHQPGCCGGRYVPAEFILINQDGSGRNVITIHERDRNEQIAFFMNGGNSSSYLARHYFGLYLFRPAQAAGIHVCRDCGNYASYDEEGGLLASFYQESEDVSPELVIIELPGGEIIERFPLVRCPADTDFCEEHRRLWPEMMRQGPRWSPDGRYLAFVAVLDATSSDIFVYDTQDGDLRRLTYDPNWVGRIEWSPDGAHIIMEELSSDIEYFFPPSSTPNTSVWSVSVSSSEAKILYPTDETYGATNYPQRILFWLDDNRFIAYEGTIFYALDSARNLRYVDMQAGTNRILFDGDFVEISYDPIHETFALFQTGSGTSLVSMRNGIIQNPDFYQVVQYWDENTGLFVSDSTCRDDPQGLQALDYQGNIHCVPNPELIRSPLEFPAPNGQWSVTVNDGLWLETNDEPAVLVSQETGAEIFWCPDSSCFFFTAEQEEDWRWTLYHVSLPDLTIEMVDEDLESRDRYQWLGGE